MAQKFGLFVLHFSVQHNHIHLIAEAKDNRALSRGMRSLARRFAKILRWVTHHKGYGPKSGSVFKGRYHLHVLKTLLEVKNAMKYVLLNFSIHRKLIEHIDEFSSALFFTKWKELIGKKYALLIREQVEDVFDQKRKLKKQDWGLSNAQSWLSRRGWKLA